MEHKFKSINNFESMYRHAAEMLGHTFEYQIKPKLHGSNVSVYVNKGQVEVRSKNRVLSAEDDHLNAYKSLMKYKNYFIDWAYTQEVVFMGEWAGEGVHRGSTDAVCTLKGKCFYIFAVMIDNIVYTDFENEFWWGYYEGNEDIKWVPTLNTIEIPMDNTKSVQSVVDWINDRVGDFEVRDEYICDLYDLDNIHGEGIVGVRDGISFDDYFKYAFKAKTAAHQVKKTKAPAAVKDPIPQNSIAFAETFVTEPRFKQCLSELDVDLDMKNTGKVIQWMNTDIQKESVDELLDMQTEWSAVSKVVNMVIVRKWKEMVNAI